MIHQLKIESEYFEQIHEGVKKFEVRKNDRNFHVGDFLGLNEITDHVCNDKGERNETGRFILVRITNVFNRTEYVMPELVIMSIEACDISKVVNGVAPIYDEN